MIVADTPIWSELFRRKGSGPVADQLAKLIEAGEVLLLGPVRQEILSGISQHEQFVRLREGLAAFPNPTLTSEDYALAAEFFTRCRAAGIQGSNTDFLICAFANRRDLQIWTLEGDFAGFARVLPIRFYASDGTR